MKQAVLITFLILGAFHLQAQETVGGKVLKRAKDKTVQRGEQKTEQAIDKSLDKVEEGIGKLFKKKGKKSKESNEQEHPDTENLGASPETTSGSSGGESEPSKKRSPTTSGQGGKGMKLYSKFDFVPGERILAVEDFSETAVGDFPLGWNTNSSAEVVTLDDNPGKWLFMTKDGYFQPDFVKDMPENFTLEFNVFTRYRSNNLLLYKFFIYASDNPKRDLSEKHLANAFQFNWQGCINEAGFFVTENGEEANKNEGLNIAALACKNETYDIPSEVKFSIWRQKNRLRIYANETKIIDIPQAFNPKASYNVFKFGADYMNYSEQEDQDEFMVSNIRYAVGSPDTRSKLITEGKLVTRGILFDVNSDVIKPSSYGVLKEIATALAENPEIKVKIIGHTDSDGDDKTNLTLSQKRALAVKSMLSSEFKIDASRMQTDGKGEAEPSDSNDTTIGKANNRRVEFIKL